MTKQILLLIGGGIAAYKCPEFVRRARDAGLSVRCVMTEASRQFVTPLVLGSVSGDKVYGDLFSLTDEHEMGHIRLARDADLVLVAPATADLMAKAAHGLAGDLASTILLATDRPVLMAPAMNPVMWQARPTARNVARLEQDGVHFIGPDSGDMACGEEGAGRMAEPLDILRAALALLNADPLEQPGDGSVRNGQSAKGRPVDGKGPLARKKALVTSGPTHEPIDPVRYIANRSSGKQGHAIAQALADAGATVTLVSGPVEIADPHNVTTIHVETAADMLARCLAVASPDIVVCAAAVADWRPAEVGAEKIKKQAGETPAIALIENPDILATLAQRDEERAGLVVGFAAETGDLAAKASAKRLKKQCDWIVANDVAAGDGVFGSDQNRVMLIRDTGDEAWPEMSKEEVAGRLVERIIEHVT